MLLNVYRGGNDESTLGPQLIFSHNKLNTCKVSEDNVPLITLTGVQVTEIFSNNFSNCNSSATLISYKDTVRASHIFRKNILLSSGTLEKDVYVTEKDNSIK